MSTAPRSPASRPAPKPQAREVQPANDSAEKKAPASGPCAHPRVQIVARAEDSEFVECLECREVFESSEFRDMQIEEKIQDEPE